MPPAVRVTFEPGGETVDVTPGTTVLEAARLAGVQIASTCGGKGTCGDCAVRVLAGTVAPPGATEAAALRSAPADVRLACLLRAEDSLTVRPVAAVKPPASASPQPVTGGEAAVSCAIDLGTTGISASSLDREGRRLGAAATTNPQRTFGGDVASRIAAALDGHGRELQELAARGMDDALAATGADLSAVRRLAVAGNTAMTHLALGAEVAGLAAHPFAGALRGTVTTTAARLGLEAVPPDTLVVFMPPIAAFVGGDTTAGVVATGIDAGDEIRVLLDLGTNAEVVVSAGGTLTVASAAAGPAFEAAGLSCGSPAVAGAVRAVRVEGASLALDVVDDAPAVSLCGSGALSLVAALLEAGHLDPSGRMHAEGPLRERFHHRGDVLAVQVAGDARAERDVYLTQLDVRELQLAKAAVATALELALEEAGVGWERVTEVLLAGAFGAGLDGRVLRRLGVLPAGRAPHVVAAGDTALAGAEALASDPGVQSRAERVAREARGVDLAAHPRFQQTFIAHTSLRENR